MSSLKRFLKENKIQKENGFYAPTKSLTEDDGSPLKWEFRHISAKEDEEIRDAATKDVPIPGKPGRYRQKLHTARYLAEMVVASTVVPDLYNKELQDSYGVKTPADLLMALVDDPGEYQDLCLWVQEFQGYNSTMDDDVNTAKN